MTCEQVLDLGIKLSSALFTAHRSNIIHHDIKPSNILITSQGLPVLGDFGISTDVYDRTETGFSPPWAPPEVLQHLTNVRKPPTSIHWRPPCTPCSSLLAIPARLSPAFAIGTDFADRQPAIASPQPPRRAGRCGSGAAPGPEQGPPTSGTTPRWSSHVPCSVCNSHISGMPLPLPWKGCGLSQRHRASAPGHGPARSDHPFVTAMGQTGGYYRRYTCGDHRSGTDIRLRGRSPHDSATGSDTKQVATPGTKDDDNQPQ